MRYLLKVRHMPLYALKENGRWVAAMKTAQVFPNKKKAKRVLKRLNKHHGGRWHLVKS